MLDHPVIQRCQLHKVRNVKDHLPQRLRSTVGRRMTDAYHAGSALEAEAALLVLAQELDRTHPGAAASLREGLHETLTVLRLERPAHSGPHAALDELHRVDDLGVPRARRQRQTLARRTDGAALVRGRHGRGRQAVPPSQRSSASTVTASSSRTRGRQTVGPVVHNDQVSAA